MKKALRIGILVLIILALVFMVRKDLNRRKIDQEVVSIVNNYAYVDEIIIKNINNGEEEIYTFGPDIVEPLKALEPRNVLEKEKKDIDRFVKNKELEVLYKINGEELFRSYIYSMEDGYGKGVFKVEDKPYIMKVNTQYRQLNNHDMEFLKGILN